jgi:hypothetical protein
MFDLKKEATYEFPVDVKQPNPRLPGQFVTSRFHATFRALPTSQSRDMVAGADAARAAGRMGEAMDLDKDLLREATCGWRDIVVDGEAFPFSEENLEEAMLNPHCLNGLIDAYRKSIAGEAAQARRAKN